MTVFVNFFLLVVIVIVVASILYSFLGYNKQAMSLEVVSPGYMTVSEFKLNNTAASTVTNLTNATTNVSANTSVNVTTNTTMNNQNVNITLFNYTISDTLSFRANYFDFMKSFFMFVGYFLLCVYLPTGIVFLPISLITDFINRPKYVA